MTKRLTIALIALVALVLVAVLPVAATYYDINNTVYAPGATIYIGEQQLNLSWVPVGSQVGWLASAAPINTTAPSQTLTITNNQSFYVSPTLAGYAGNWYVLPVGATPQLAFSVAAPSIAVDVWDLSTGTTATGGSVIQETTWHSVSTLTLTRRSTRPTVWLIRLGQQARVTSISR